MASIVAFLRNGGNPDRLREKYPDALVDWFIDQLKRFDQLCENIQNQISGEKLEEPEIDARIVKGVLSVIDGTSLGLPSEREFH